MEINKKVKRVFKDKDVRQYIVFGKFDCHQYLTGHKIIGNLYDVNYDAAQHGLAGWLDICCPAEYLEDNNYYISTSVETVRSGRRNLKRAYQLNNVPKIAFFEAELKKRERALSDLQTYVICRSGAGPNGDEFDFVASANEETRNIRLGKYSYSLISEDEAERYGVLAQLPKE